MIGKVVPRPEFSSIVRLNDNVLDRNGAGNDPDKVMYSGALNILGGVKTATLEMEAIADKNDRIKYPMDHYIFSWQEGEQPTAAQAKEAVQIAIKELNVDRCQCVYALHQNTDNCHLHIAVCRVNLQTYKAVDPAHGWTYKAVERAARLIEQRQGWSVERNAKHYVDDMGMLHEIGKGKETSMPQATLDRENLTGEKSAIRMAKERLKDVKPETWADFHEKLAALGMNYERKGSGAIIHVGDVPIKASDAGKRFSIKAREKMRPPFLYHILERSISSTSSLFISLRTNKAPKNAAIMSEAAAAQSMVTTLSEQAARTIDIGTNMMTSRSSARHVDFVLLPID